MFAISSIVKGVLWAAAAEPVMQILGIGSMIAFFNVGRKPDLVNDVFAKWDKKRDRSKRNPEEYEK